MGRQPNGFPKYRRIAALLAAEVTARAARGYGAGGEVSTTMRADRLRLPSEAELIARFDVSRITVRQALAVLERQGLIDRLQGRRTYAAPPKLVRHLHPLVTFEEDMRRQRVELVTEVADFGLGTPAAWARVWLHGSARRRALRLVLRRIVGRMCVCHDERYVTGTIARALRRADVAGRSTREILRDRGLLLTHLLHETEVIPASMGTAEAMGFAPGTLVMQNTYVSYARKTPVEVGRACYRADRFRFWFGERQWKT